MNIRELLNLKEVRAFKSKQISVACSAPEQLVGLEIETERCVLPMDRYQDMLSKIWEVKTDGSLRGNAFEFISKPGAIGIVIPELAEFYAKTGFTDELNYTDRCSIHVHTNVQDMTPQQVATLCVVYSVVEDVLFEFVNHFKVANPSGKYRDTNVYCVPWSQCRMNFKMVENMFNDVDYAFRNWQKYTALNLIPARSLGTVEWRHMHGSADMEKVTKWLNLIGSIMNYAKTHEFPDVVKTIKELNDNSAYRQFYNEVLGDYIPFDGRYEVAIASGVVNAKYSLMGLTSMEPKLKVRKTDPKTLRWEVAEEGNIGGGAPEPGVFQAFAANAIGEIAPAPPIRGGDRNTAVRRELRPAMAGRMGVDEDVTAARQAIAAGEEVIRNRLRDQNVEYIRLNRLVTYPLQRGTTPLGWAAQTADGFIYGTNGIRMPAGTIFTPALTRAGRPQYISGFGPGFWENVEAGYTPPTMAAFEGGF